MGGPRRSSRLISPIPKTINAIRSACASWRPGKTPTPLRLALTGTDRVLVVLVEFAGTDTLTWNPGDKWDPYGKADPNEAVYDADGNVVVGDCSNIITETEDLHLLWPTAQRDSAALVSGGSLGRHDLDRELQ